MKGNTIRWEIDKKEHVITLLNIELEWIDKSRKKWIVLNNIIIKLL
jgi:hypothetical protein